MHDELGQINELESVLQGELFVSLAGETPERLRDRFFSGTIYQFSGVLNMLHDVVSHLRNSYDEEKIRSVLSRKRGLLEGLDPVRYSQDAYKSIELELSSDST